LQEPPGDVGLTVMVKSPTWSQPSGNGAPLGPEGGYWKEEPVEIPVHHEPPANIGRLMSMIEPGKGLVAREIPTLTSTQVARGAPLGPHSGGEEVPVEIPVHHEPPCKYRR